MVFIPTYLYVKHHTVTGMRYFGKTTRSEYILLNKYNGSGKRWNLHINKHGKEYIVTEWYMLFTDKDSIKEFALFFSEIFNITKSDNWANIVPEDGLSGGNTGGNKLPRTQEQKDILSKARLGVTPWNKGISIPGPMVSKTHSEETKAKMKKPKSEKHKSKISEYQTGCVFWNNGVINKRSHSKPIGDWVRGRI
jgi:hypothetical protein